MLPLLLFTLVGSEPPPDTAVILARRGIAAPKATRLVGQVEQALAARGVAVVTDLPARLKRIAVKDALFCGGKRACLAELGRQLKVSVVVSVSVTEVKPDLSISLEAVGVVEGARLAERTAVLPLDGTGLAQEVFTFADALRAARAPAPPPLVDALPPPPPPPPDTPRNVEVVPKAEAAPVMVVAPTPPARPAWPAWVALGGAAALAGGSVALAVDGSSVASQLKGATALGDGRFASPLTAERAAAVRDRANLETGVAIGCAVGAVALGVLAVVVWPREAAQ